MVIGSGSYDPQAAQSWEPRSRRNRLGAGAGGELGRAVVVKRTWLYRRLRHFRAGIEGIISFLKRSFGWDRCSWRSYGSFTDAAHAPRPAKSCPAGRFFDGKRRFRIQTN